MGTVARELRLEMRMEAATWKSIESKIMNSTEDCGFGRTRKIYNGTRKVNQVVANL